MAADDVVVGGDESWSAASAFIQPQQYSELLRTFSECRKILLKQWVASILLIHAIVFFTRIERSNSVFGLSSYMDAGQYSR